MNRGRYKKTLISISLIFVCLILVGCTTTEHIGFSIFLLANEVPAADLITADLNSLELQGEPILSVKDMVSYSWASHEIFLTSDSYERIQQLFALPVKVTGIPFVACVGKTRIYAGAFWTPVSSLSFDGVIVQQPFGNDPIIRISLGYPTSEAFTGWKDPRVDLRIWFALQANRKVIP